MTTTNTKELIQLVSKQSGYYLYQVEDMLYALAVVLQEQIDKGNEVKIKGIGAFTYKVPRLIQNYSPYSGRYMNKYTKRTCKFKPDLLFLNYLNREVTDDNSNQ